MSWRSFRVRIAAIIVLLTVVLGLGGTARARADLTRIARAELEKRGVTIARDLAVQHADKVMVGDIYALYTVVNDFLVNNPDLRYVTILGPDGEVLVSSFEQGIPPGLLEANSPEPGAPYHVERLPTTDGTVYDIVVPVAEGSGGVVRVGMLESPVQAAVDRQTMGLLTLTAFITLLGAVAAVGLGSYLARPLSELVRATRAVAQGDLTRKAPVSGTVEVQQLGEAFDKMTAALATSRDILVRRNEELAGLNAISSAVGRSLELQEVLDAALGSVLEQLDLPGGWVYLLEGSGRTVLGAQQGRTPDLAQPPGEANTLCPCQEALVTGSVPEVDRIARCPRLGHDADLPGGCHVMVPLRSGERVLGVMNLVCASDQQECGEASLRHLPAIGHHVGVAVENARLYREVQRKEALRGQLVRKLIAVQEEERRRIARELHDQYAQALTALTMGIEATERGLTEGQGALKSQLRDVKELAANSLDQTYDLIFDLRPTTLDDLGLVPAVRWYAESRLKSLGVAYHLEAAIPRRRLSPELETACYRVLQESLLNVAKHAQASSVRIQIRVRDTHLEAEVEDDGCGFDHQAVEGDTSGGRGLGLLGMHERLELLGGVLRIESRHGQGTRIVMQAPLRWADGTGGEASSTPEPGAPGASPSGIADGARPTPRTNPDGDRRPASSEAKRTAARG